MKTNLENVLRLHTQEAESAFEVLTGGRVPPEYQYERSGRGGTSFTYIPHQVATELLIKAFGPYFSWRVTEVRQYGQHEGMNFPSPKSVSATGELALYIVYGDHIIERAVSATGAFDNTGKFNSAAADASAVSMALSKVLIRAFGFGLEFYPTPEPVGGKAPDPATRNWKALLGYAESHGVTEDEIVASMQTQGYSGADLARDAVLSAGKQMVDRLAAAMQRSDTEPKAPPIQSPVSAPPETASSPPTTPLPPGLNRAKAGDSAAGPPVGKQPPVDQVIEAAKELGGETVVPQNWGDFYIYVGQNTSFGSGSSAGAVLDVIFDPRPRPKGPGPIWQEMYDALAEWDRSGDDTDLHQQIISKYSGFTDAEGNVVL